MSYKRETSKARKFDKMNLSPEDFDAILKRAQYRVVKFYAYDMGRSNIPWIIQIRPYKDNIWVDILKTDYYDNVCVWWTFSTKEAADEFAMNLVGYDCYGVRYDRAQTAYSIITNLSDG